MTAFDTIRKLYESQGRLDDFNVRLADHLETGIVFSLPEAFVMGKAIKLEDGRITWFIEAAAGKLSALIRCWPGYLPWVAFRRAKDSSKRLRIYSTERFFRLTTKIAGGH